MSSPSFPITWPKPAIFGAGTIAQIGARTRDLDGSRVLVASDAGLKAVGIVDRVLGLLRDAGLHADSYTAISPNPRSEEVEGIVTLWQQGGFDTLIALGGGSVIDASKGAVLRLLTGRPLDSIHDEGITETPRNPPRFIIVPTTSGTGSETTLGAVLKTPTRKLVVRSIHAQPDFTFLDPELVATLPPRATAITGIDVLMHALGTLTANTEEPIGEMMAREAMRRAATNILRVYEHGSDIAARGEMMLASYLAGHGIAVKGIDGIHGLSTPVESLTDCAHGDSLGVIFPHVMRFNMQAAGARYAMVARDLALAEAATPDAEAAEALRLHLVGIRDRFGMPTTLGTLGVTHAMIPELTRQALLSVATKRNARPLDTAAIAALYEEMI